MDNAIRYTPEGGTITLSLFRDGDWARLEVADTGMGIAPEHLPHIFDRFYRVDKGRSRANGGSGLGLAIVKAIAEQHRGKVTVTSEPGKGSTFTVWLKL
jgi:signal transduction histidine kinase